LLYIAKSIRGTLSVRCTRSKKVSSLKLKDGTILRVRIVPWIPVEDHYIWLVSMAVGKSNRQINDWMNKRKNKRARSLAKQMTGKAAMQFQLLAMDQVRTWMDEHPGGDSITFRCESVEAEKQFRIWKKWFRRKEAVEWQVLDEELAFYYYKPMVLD
jgi:hypothetical protein